MRNIAAFFKSKKTAIAGAVLALIAIAHQLGYIDSEQMANMVALAGSMGFIAAKDADKTGT